MKRTTTLLAAGLATLVLGGCGSESDDAAPQTAATASATSGSAPPSSAAPSSAVPSTQFNYADVAFAQMMIPHHRQALAMAELAEGRAADPAVTKLAAAVESSQGREIRTMTTWLTTWGEKVPTDSMPDMDHSSHGGGAGMPGMMSEADMMTLEALSGTEFDRSWLTMMVAHHQGAVQMAREQQKNGENPDAVALARKIQSDQETEIKTMKGLLGGI